MVEMKGGINDIGISNYNIVMVAVQSILLTVLYFELEGIFLLFVIFILFCIDNSSFCILVDSLFHLELEGILSFYYFYVMFCLFLLFIHVLLMQRVVSEFSFGHN